MELPADKNEDLLILLDDYFHGKQFAKNMMNSAEFRVAVASRATRLRDRLRIEAEELQRHL